ncbi:permease [Haliea sp.]
MQEFATLWHEAAITSLGFFWMALWAFVLGYIISSLIQVLITRSRMQQAMGKDGVRSIALGTFFGFLSSSCSFSALATTRAIFNKGAGLAPSLAFMLASTNLVIELGMVITIFLGWQFVVGEYVGGILLILVTWLLVRITRPRRLEAHARRKMDDGDAEADGGDKSWKEKITSREGWQGGLAIPLL